MNNKAIIILIAISVLIMPVKGGYLRLGADISPCGESLVNVFAIRMPCATNAFEGLSIFFRLYYANEYD
jgi:hypothetical protein